MVKIILKRERETDSLIVCVCEKERERERSGRKASSVIEREKDKRRIQRLLLKE